MSTPLTAYFSNAAATTVATANKLYTASGTPANVNNTSALGAATGYGEVTAQGTATAWAGAGSAPSPSGKGFLLDATTLEGNDLLTGTYTASVRLNTIGAGAVNITADIHCRAYKRSSTGTYTLIGDGVLSAQLIKTTKIVFNPTFTTSANTSFASGDKLYIDILLNVTANGGASTQTIQLNDLSTDTTNHLGMTTAQIVTPGYNVTGAGGGGSGVTAGNPYGITIGSTTASGTLNAQAITDMQTLGITWLRYQVGWDLVDTSGTTAQNAATYHWGSWDSAVSQCNAAGINICLTIFHAPSQFQDGGANPNPLDPTFTANFAAQIATRYNGGAHGTVNAIEVANEDYDNSSGTSAAPLVLTMNAVYPAVKAVSASIVVGCAALLQRNEAHYTSFMETLLNPTTGAYSGGVFQANYLNLHFYTGIPTAGGTPPNTIPVDLDPNVEVPAWNGGAGLPSITTAWQHIQAKANAYSVTVPLWVTETGFTINTNPSRSTYDVVTQSGQWTYLKDVLDSCRQSNYVTKVFIFTLAYFTGYPAPNYRDGMSLVQGTSASPQYTTAFNNLQAYISTFPTWGAGGGGGGGGTTALTTYFSNAAATTVATANQLYTVTGTPANVNNASALGAATGYGEVTSQGTATAWAGAGSAPSPSGKGFLLDATTLEGNDLITGAYTAALRLNTTGAGAVNITADIHCRAYKRSSTGTYTLIADAVLTAQSIKTTKTVFNPTFTTSANTSFATGDKLYIDILLNVTANGGASTQTINLSDLSTDTVGKTGLNTADMLTPGYQATSGGGTPPPPPPPPFLADAPVSVADLSVFKEQQVLVFAPNGTTFLGVWTDAPLLAGFKETMNAATTPIQIELPRPFDNFDLVGAPGSHGTVGQGNVVQYWLYGPGLPTTGLLRFQGRIDGYAPQIKDTGEETVVITITPMHAALGDSAIAGANTFGAVGNPSGYPDAIFMFDWWFNNNDPNTSNPYSFPLTLDSSNPSSSGRKAQYSFQNQNLLSIFQTILLMLPPNWFFRPNPDNTVTLNAAPTLPQHTVDLAQHVVNPQYNADWTRLKNIVYFTGQSQASSTNPNLQVPIVSATVKGSDISIFGARYQFANDNRVIDQDTATLLAQGLLDALDRYTLRTKIRIPDYRGDLFANVGYDIESLKVGDSIQLVDMYGAPSSSSLQSLWDAAHWDVQNWDAASNAVISPVVQIVSIDYNWYYVDLELGALQPNQDYALFQIQQRFSDFTMV